MTAGDSTRGGPLGFLDALGGLFRKEKKAAEATAPAPPARFQEIEAELEATIRALNERLEKSGPASSATALRGASREHGVEDRKAQQQKRMEAAHQAIREDIVAMHARLGTGVSPADLDAITAFLGELEGIATAGRASHEVLPRMRYAIAERLWREAGGLAVAQLVALLERAKLEWPDPIRHGPTETAAETERSRRRRLSDVRESFLAQTFARTADRLIGVVRGWQDDYPDRGTPLWEESVLEGVAAALRGKLVLASVEILRRDRDALMGQVEQAIGSQLAALRQLVAGSADSIEQASQAMASTLRVVDEVVPGIAWEYVCTQLPAARGGPAA